MKATRFFLSLYLLMAWKVGDASSLALTPKSLSKRMARQPITTAAFPQQPTTKSSHLSMSADTNAENLSSRISRLRAWTSKNFFLVGMFTAVGLARLFPHLGKNGGVLRPELVIGKFGVSFVFLISGLSLELAQLGSAFARLKLNALIQFVGFGVWPVLVGEPMRQLFSAFNLLPAPLLDGLLILTTLPTTVNMCVILSQTAGGNVATALCNAVMSNLAGIFVTPALLYKYFGAQIQLPFWDMFLKLCNKVLLPVAVGQVLRFTFVKSIYEKNSKLFKRSSEVILLSILWNAFCTAITTGLGLDLRSSAILLGLLPILHLAFLGTTYLLFSRLSFERDQVVAAMFCASQKTLAFGLPLIHTIFAGSQNLAAYCAPLMFVHPLQLMVGSALIPRLEAYVQGVATGE